MTAVLREIPFVDEPAVHHGSGPAPSRMPPGAFARDPDRFEQPSEPTSENQTLLVPAGPALTIVVHPGDIRGLSLHPDRRRLNGCCRLDGCDGPNLVCAGCGAEIATEQSDCWVSWHDVRLDPAAVVEHRPNSEQL